MTRLKAPPQRQAVLRRLLHLGPGDRRFFVVGGREVAENEADSLEVPLGPVGARHGPWWQLPLPACPDCRKGVIIWWEAGLVPGARKCVGPPEADLYGRLRHDPDGGCGSLFVIQTREA